LEPDSQSGGGDQFPAHLQRSFTGLDFPAQVFREFIKIFQQAVYIPIFLYQFYRRLFPYAGQHHELFLGCSIHVDYALCRI
jgi:hypothetical protein